MAMNPEEELQRQNERLELLLNLTSKITSSLKIREVLRAIAANIREVIHADAVVVSLPEAASGKSRVIAVDFPHGKGAVKEEVTVTLSPANKKVMDTLKPVVICTKEREELAAEAYEIVAAEGIKAICLIPLVDRGRVLGTLSISRTTETPFVPEDVDFLSRASGQIAIAIANALAYREISELKDKLAQEKLYLEEEFRSEMGFEQIIGNSKALKHVLQQVETVAPSDSTVLLLGETGTGKELIARAIHDRSQRVKRTFVKLNCAAIPTGLLESELFGHEKGAFTGAVATKKGKFDIAGEGTLFLDEIGELAPPLQAKLLRVLQQREFERLGGNRLLPFNARVLAATNKNLEEAIKTGEFRQDLYYRLNVVSIAMPPLREHREDIPLLALYFANKHAAQCHRGFKCISAEARALLMQYSWPGNVRELRNVVERVVVTSEAEVIGAEFLDGVLPVDVLDEEPNTFRHRVERFERRLLEDALRKHGSTREVARALGISQSSVVRKLRSRKPLAQ